MKKLETNEKDKLHNLLNMILLITKEGQAYAIKNDVVNLVKIIKLREDYVVKLRDLCSSVKLNDETLAFILVIEKETTLLLEKMKLSKNNLSRNLVSLYNGKQVVKYF